MWGDLDITSVTHLYQKAHHKTVEANLIEKYPLLEEGRREKAQRKRQQTGKQKKLHLKLSFQIGRCFKVPFQNLCEEQKRRVMEVNPHPRPLCLPTATVWCPSKATKRTPSFPDVTLRRKGSLQ